MKKWAGLLSAGVMLLSSSHLAASENNTIYLYDWSEYIPSGLLEDFTKETGIKVILSSFESNETMYAKLKTMGKENSYDVIAPSNYFVEKMRKEGMLLPLDHSKLPALKELDPNMLNKEYDPHNQFSVPQVFGTTSIAYNKDNVDVTHLTSWADLWKPEYKGKLQLTDDARDIFHMALLKLGLNPNTTDPAEIKQAYEELLKMRKNVAAFNSDNAANTFISGEIDVGTLWNGSAYIARKEGTPVNVVWPTEGTILWMDTLAIPATSKNPEAAHKLINYLISAPVAKRVALEIGYPTPNLVARQSLPKEVVEDTNLYPPQEVLDKGVWQNDVGSAVEIYENYFQQFKAAE